jgi:hypothetical protein
LTAVILLVFASPTGAEGRKIDPQLSVREGMMRAAFPIPGVLDDELRERINSGLTNRIVLTVWLETPDGKWKGPEGVMTIQAAYDVWEESYTFQRQDLAGHSRKVFKEQNAVAAELSRIDDLPVPLPKQPPDHAKKLVFRVMVSVNPPSKALLEKAKEYLSDPEGTRRLNTSRTAFGSFAHTFIPAALSEGGRVHEFSSPPFAAASVPGLPFAGGGR